MMTDLNDICDICGHICNAKHFQQNFRNWTSGNVNIDNFIKDTQLSAHIIDHYYYGVSKSSLEWIPYDRLYNIKCFEDRFGKIYRANWIDGNIIHWDNEKKDWRRINQNVLVILKILNNPAL
ncbi:hypothetical protein RclHR1_10530005 [Rhizophagus clarus]|uniref:Uncharacterized protein n=1 Tax=Rhizophagus clarus TaxID=94130 RepID=A0A2Z6Q6C9_9GLOM|nr:hypothetical protein RclHR1_10530005 [Rhizophagus clarus]